MKGMSLTFPIAWNGLVQGRIDDGKIENFNQMFGCNYRLNDPLDPSRDNTLDKYTSGTQRIAYDIKRRILAFDNEKRIGDFVQRIHDVNISQIRSVVSAFDLFLATEKIKIWEPYRKMLDEALAKNNPELYVAYALIIGVRNRSETQKLSSEDLKRLQKLEKETEYPDVFPKAQKAVIENEKQQTTFDVEDAELWQRVLDVQKENPGCFRKLTLNALRNMTMDDLAMFECACVLLFRHFDHPSKKLPSTNPFLLNVRDIETVNINEAITLLNDDDFVHMETLGLISHPRDFFLIPWVVTEHKRVIEGGVLTDATSSNCLLVQRTAGSKEYGYKLNCHFLTDVGLEIYWLVGKYRKNHKTSINSSYYVTWVAEIFQNLELQKDNPSLKFEVYPLRRSLLESPEHEGARLKIDFTHDILQEKTLTYYEDEKRHIKQYEEHFSKEYPGKKQFIESELRYCEYLEQFPELKDYELVKNESLPDLNKSNIASNDEEDFTEPV